MVKRMPGRESFAVFLRIGDADFQRTARFRHGVQLHFLSRFRINWRSSPAMAKTGRHSRKSLSITICAEFSLAWYRTSAESTISVICTGPDYSAADETSGSGDNFRYARQLAHRRHGVLF